MQNPNVVHKVLYKILHWIGYVLPISIFPDSINGVVDRNALFLQNAALFPVQLYTTWRHPGLSFVYETSPTFRRLKR
jgi:hypothetical protein